MSSPLQAAATSPFLAGGGEMGHLMRAHDWLASPLGAPERWPQPLKTLVGVMLGSNQAMFVAWGAERTMLYNDRYAELLQDRHPAALGRTFAEVWWDIMDDVGPILDRAFVGEATHMDDIAFLLTRESRSEEAHFAFSYTPVRDEAGAVAGTFCACSETTGQVFAERRITAERDRQRKMFEQAPGFITILSGPELRFEFVNDAYDRLFGRRGFVGKTVREAFPDLEGQPFFDLLDNAYATGERFVARTIPIRLQATPATEPADHFLDFIYEPVRDEAGAVTGLFIEGHDVTERVRAEEALKEAERRLSAAVDAAGLSADFRALFEASPTPFLVVAPPDWTIVAANDARVEVAGISREAQIGRKLFDLFPDDPNDPTANGVANLTASFERVIATRAGDAMAIQRYAVQGPDGCFVERWWSPVNSPVLDRSGNVALIIHRVEDVTEIVQLRGEAEASDQLTRDQQAVIDRLRASESALQASEEFARRILASSVDCIKVLDLDARLEFMSEGGMCVMEVDDLGAIEGACWPDLWLGDEHAKAVGAVEEAKRGGVGRFQGFATTMKGSPRWWDVAVSPISGADGRPAKLLSVSRDITEQREAAERLRELNADLERQVAERTRERGRTWDVSPDLLCVFESHGRFSAVNPAWTTTLGWTQDELVGTSYNEFLHPEDAELTAKTLEALQGDQPVLSHANRYRTKDGNWRWLSWVAVPVDKKFYCSARDITLEKEREAELFQAQEALRQSQKMEAMGSLTGGVAHDFNNLLTPIIGSLDMLVRKGIGSERERRLIDGALQSAERAKTLVQRLLAFARRQPLQPVAVDVGRLVEGMTGLIGSTLGPAIDVQVDLAPDLPPAQADLNQLEMALLNLAVNARDAMPEGGKLTIAAKRESVRRVHKSGVKPGHYVRLCVTDSGVGMDQATITRAVEPFYSTKGIGKGTGLGLSMVHGLAAQLKGGLTIESEPGRGTSIELWLPISASVLYEDEETPIAPSARVGRGRALLVDDEELVRMSTADMLIDLGFEVVEAGSAEEALALINTGRVPDLLVTDHLMPGMTGAELAQEARALKPALPVLLVSGYAEVEGIAPGLPRLTKPFRSADLATSLAALINSAGKK